MSFIRSSRFRIRSAALGLSIILGMSVLVSLAGCSSKGEDTASDGKTQIYTGKDFKNGGKPMKPVVPSDRKGGGMASVN